MNNISQIKPSISFHIKYSVILIHKSALYLLGNPSYIQILINPYDKSIVLCKASENDYLAHHIDAKVFSFGNHSYKLYSKALLQELCKMYPTWKNKTYRIYGEYFPASNMLKFNMANSFDA